MGQSVLMQKIGFTSRIVEDLPRTYHLKTGIIKKKKEEEEEGVSEKANLLEICLKNGPESESDYRGP